MITVTNEKTKKLKTWVGIFKNMDGNIPGGNFPGGEFDGWEFSGGGGGLNYGST